MKLLKILNKKDMKEHYQVRSINMLTKKQDSEQKQV